jgi:hypothetical protein
MLQQITIPKIPKSNRAHQRIFKIQFVVFSFSFSFFEFVWRLKMYERLPSSFMGYLLGASNSPSSQVLGLNINVGLFKLSQLPKDFKLT